MPKDCWCSCSFVCFLIKFLWVCLIFQLAQRNVTGIQWVASEAWVTASLLTSSHFHPVLEGTLGFSFPTVRIPGFKEFLLNVYPSPKPGMTFVNMFWEELFGCRLEFKEDHSKENQAVDNFEFNAFGYKTDSQNNSGYLVRPIVGKTSMIKESADENYKGAAEKPVCTGSEDLRYTNSSFTDVSDVSYNVYKAVYAIAHALHTLLNCDSAGHNKGTCDNHKLFTSRQVS